MRQAVLGEHEVGTVIATHLVTAKSAQREDEANNEQLDLEQDKKLIALSS